MKRVMRAGRVEALRTLGRSPPWDDGQSSVAVADARSSTAADVRCASRAVARSSRADAWTAAQAGRPPSFAAE